MSDDNKPKGGMGFLKKNHAAVTAGVQEQTMMAAPEPMPESERPVVVEAETVTAPPPPAAPSIPSPPSAPAAAAAPVAPPAPPTVSNVVPIHGGPADPRDGGDVLNTMAQGAAFAPAGTTPSEAPAAPVPGTDQEGPGAGLTTPDSVAPAEAVSPEEAERLRLEEEEKLRKEAEARLAAGLPPLPPDAPDIVKALAAPFTAIGMGVLQTARDQQAALASGIADRAARLQQAQAHERGMAEAKRNPGGGGGRGLPIPSFSRKPQSRELEGELSSLTRQAERQRASGSMAERMALQHVADARQAAIKLHSGREALKEAVVALNTKLDGTPAAQDFLTGVDKYAKGKGISRDEAFETLRQSPNGLLNRNASEPEVVKLRDSARELSRNPELAPLFDQADQLAGEVKTSAKGMARSLASLRRSGHDVSGASEALRKLEGDIPSSKVPNLDGKDSKLEQLSEETKEQMRRIAEAITGMINRLVERVKSVFGR